MTKLLEKALEAVIRLPSESQDEIARAMMRLPSPAANRKPSTPSICALRIEEGALRDDNGTPCLA